MPQYMVNSAILNSKDPKACAEGAAKMLASGKFKDVQLDRVTVPAPRAGLHS